MAGVGGGEMRREGDVFGAREYAEASLGDRGWQDIHAVVVVVIVNLFLGRDYLAENPRLTDSLGGVGFGTMGYSFDRWMGFSGSEEDADDENGVCRMIWMMGYGLWMSDSGRLRYVVEKNGSLLLFHYSIVIIDEIRIGRIGATCRERGWIDARIMSMERSRCKKIQSPQNCLGEATESI